MKIKTFNSQISVARWEREGGGVHRNFLDEIEENVNEFLEECEKTFKRVYDIKVNHYTVHRHNNGGSDEVWVQYTIMYG